VKNLSFQEYIDLSQTSVSNFFGNFLPIFTNIIAAVITISIGIIVGWVLKWVITEVSRAIGLERTLSGLAFYTRITKSHEEIDFTSLIGEVARWIAIIVFLLPALASLQIQGGNEVFSQVFGYTSNVILASLYLLFGFVIAWFIHRIIMATTTVLGTNPAHLLANVAYLAIVVFASLQAVLQLGITDDIIRLMVIAVLAASALAFGLAGKDTASDMIKKFMDKAK